MDQTDMGRQPFVYQEYTAMTNGEIYNHKSLEAEFGIQNRGNSDCELIPQLFSKVCLSAVNVDLINWDQDLNG